MMSQRAAFHYMLYERCHKQQQLEIFGEFIDWLELIIVIKH